MIHTVFSSVTERSRGLRVRRPPASRKVGNWVGPLSQSCTGVVESMSTTKITVLPTTKFTDNERNRVGPCSIEQGIIQQSEGLNSWVTLTLAIGA